MFDETHGNVCWFKLKIIILLLFLDGLKKKMRLNFTWIWEQTFFVCLFKVNKGHLDKLKDIRFILKCVKLTKYGNLPLFPLTLWILGLFIMKNTGVESDFFHFCRFWGIFYGKKTGVLLPYTATQVKNLIFFSSRLKI